MLFSIYRVTSFPQPLWWLLLEPYPTIKLSRIPGQYSDLSAHCALIPHASFGATACLLNESPILHNIQRLALCYLFLTKPLYIRWREQLHKVGNQPLIITWKTVEIPLLRHFECLLSLFSMLGDHRKPQPIFSFEILASHKTSHICLRVTQTDFFHCFAFHLPLGCSPTLQTCCTCWSELLRTASLFHFVKSCSTKGLSKSAKAACQSPGPC